MNGQYKMNINDGWFDGGLNLEGGMSFLMLAFIYANCLESNISQRTEESKLLKLISIHGAAKLDDWQNPRAMQLHVLVIRTTCPC